MRLPVFAAVILLFLGTTAWPTGEQDGFSVSGIVTFTKEGTIYMRLVDKTGFRNMNSGTYHRLILPWKGTGSAAGTAPFCFERVRAGTWAIMAFQDLNGNGRLDAGAFGPAEPWGCYKPARPGFRPPRFNDVSFTVAGGMSGLTVVVK